MQKLQLYIEGQRVDLFKDESVSFTQTIQNVRDIGKIFTEFTKTFSVPASKKNNIIFQHYYNSDIRNGYDARNKQDANLELNDLPFKSGKIKLEGVDLKDNVAHTYRITFFGNTVNMKDILGDDQLSSLSGLSSHNQIYSTANVLSRMQSESNDILVPLITHTDRMFYDTALDVYGNVVDDAGSPDNGINWNQFKYAIRVNAIIAAIELKYPSIVFSDDFFKDVTNEQFNELFLWLHRKKGGVETSSQVAVSWTQLDELNTLTTTGFTDNIVTQLNGQITINNTNPYLSHSSILYFTPVTLGQNYSVRVTEADAGLVASFTDLQGSRNLTIPPNQNGTYTIQVYSDPALSFDIGDIAWETNTSMAGGIIFGFVSFKNSVAFDTSSDLQFNISEQIPKMTIINFLSGLFKMFNLTAYVVDGIIIVKTLDSYYGGANFDLINNYTNRVESDGGTVESTQCINLASSGISLINIDEYLDTTKQVVNVALPFKEIDFFYKGLGTFLAKQFEQVNNTGWGSLNYTLNNEIFDAPSKKYKIELPFEHLMYERLYNVADGSATDIQWGYFVDDNQESYFGSPLLFYPIGITGGTNIPVLNTPSGSGQTIIDDYFIPSNSLSISCATSKTNIHFSSEINEYTALTDPLCFTDTLFETKYKTYVQDVFDASRRIVKVTAFLPMKIFYNLQLNDLIQLGQDSYKINSLTTNLTTGKTTFELLNTIL